MALMRKSSKSKSFPKLKRDLEMVFNKFIRWRDWKKGCISCGRFIAWGGQWHAGHFHPVSTTFAALRFDEKNVNGQCCHCNTFLEGNKEGYRRGLVQRYGETILEELDVKRTVSRGNIWTRFHYEALIAHYKEKNKAIDESEV